MGSQAGGLLDGQFPHHGHVIGNLCANKNGPPPQAATHNVAPTGLHQAVRTASAGHLSLRMDGLMQPTGLAA